MNRTDVEASRDLAERYVKVCDELLASHIDIRGTPSRQEWDDTAWIAGKATGAHRRLSLDLTGALSHMRRRR